MKPKIDTVPQYNGAERITYTWAGDVLTVAALGLVEVVDFTALPNGAALDVTECQAEVLPFNPVLAASRSAAGRLAVTLLDWTGPAAVAVPAPTLPAPTGGLK